MENTLTLEEAIQQLALIFPTLKVLLEKYPEINELSEIEQLLIEGVGDILKQNPQIRLSDEEQYVMTRYYELF